MRKFSNWHQTSWQRGMSPSRWWNLIYQRSSIELFANWNKIWENPTTKTDWDGEWVTWFGDMCRPNWTSGLQYEMHKFRQSMAAIIRADQPQKTIWVRIGCWTKFNRCSHIASTETQVAEWSWMVSKVKDRGMFKYSEESILQCRLVEIKMCHTFW